MTSETSVTHILPAMPVLRGERISLRGIELDQAAAIIDIAVYDGVFATNEAEAAVTLKRIHADIARGESLHWGIFMNDTHEIAGTCGYYRGYPGNSGEIGYLLKPGHRSRGLMTEALKLIIPFGFEALKLERVVAYTAPDNQASIAVLGRLGFTEVKNTDTDRKFVLTSWGQ